MVRAYGRLEYYVANYRWSLMASVLAIAAEFSTSFWGWQDDVRLVFWGAFFLPLVLAERYLRTERYSRRWLWCCVFSYLGLAALLAFAKREPPVNKCDGGPARASSQTVES